MSKIIEPVLTGKLKFCLVTEIHSRIFEDALHIYNSSFPANERQTDKTIIERVATGLNQLYAGLLNDEVVFMALLWPLKKSPFILLDYMATKAEYRGKNIGSFFLESMLPALVDNEQYFVIETENPDFGNNKEQRERRVSFYRRNGARELQNIHYILPALQGTESTEMLLMIFPDFKGGIIESGIIKNLITQIYRELYNLNAEDTVLKDWQYKPDEIILLT